jgi:hypothetical protein
MAAQLMVSLVGLIYTELGSWSRPELHGGEESEMRLLNRHISSRFAWRVCHCVFPYAVIPVRMKVSIT